MLLVLIDPFILDSCKDLKAFCKYGPSCEEEVVKQQCPRLCGTCVPHNDDSCKDLKDFCKYKPSCEDDEVKRQCPKLCNACPVTREPLYGGIYELTNIKV